MKGTGERYMTQQFNEEQKTKRGGQGGGGGEAAMTAMVPPLPFPLIPCSTHRPEPSGGRRGGAGVVVQLFRYTRVTIIQVQGTAALGGHVTGAVTGWGLLGN